MASANPSGALGPSALELAPYVAGYWRDRDREEAYAAVVIGVHIDQLGNIVGQSYHVNGPSADWNDALMSDLMAAADGEVA